MTIGCHASAPRPSSLSCQKPALCKVRVVFSKPVHAVRAWGGPPGTNHGLFKANPSRGVRHERNLVHRLQKSKLKSRNPEIQAEIQKSTVKSRNPL